MALEKCKATKYIDDIGGPFLRTRVAEHVATLNQGYPYSSQEPKL